MMSADFNQTSIHSQTLALAGVMQATGQVHDVATTGLSDPDATRVCLRSALSLSAGSIQDAVGQPGELRYGLRQLQALFSGNQQKLPMLQYAMQIMQLQKNLSHDRSRQRALGQELELISRYLSRPNATQEAQSSSTDAVYLQPEIISQLANAWSEQVRSLKPQITVQGKPLYLQNDSNVHMIRALLLSALRSAWLWQQLGGRRWHLIFRRKRILQATRDLLHA